MRLAKRQYTLCQIMLAIAVLAGLFAVFGVVDALGILLAIGVVCLPILLAPSGRKLRAAGRVCSLYPLLILGSLYATWITAWCVLGHRPRSFLDDPKFISPIVDVLYISTALLWFGVPLFLFLCLPLVLVLAHDVLTVRRAGGPTLRTAARLLVPLLVWPSVFVLLLADPLGVLDWYLD